MRSSSMIGENMMKISGTALLRMAAFTFVMETTQISVDIQFF